MRITPPTRAMSANGPPTWAMPRLARGTPPNGKENRSASTSVWASGRITPITAPPIDAARRRAGTVSSATPCRPRGHDVGGEVARRGQLPHPGHADGQPGEGEQEAEAEAARAARRDPSA